MQLNFIGNSNVLSSSGKTLPVLDPSDGQPFDELQRSNAQDIDAAVRAARDCFDTTWHKVSAAERGRLMMKLSQKIAAHADELALLEQRDCGKPVKQARADALALVRYFEFYGGAGDKVHGQTIPFLAGYTALTLREPHGVVAGIIPWNYPMQILARVMGAALAMGNTLVVKPAEDASLSTLRIAGLADSTSGPAFSVPAGLLAYAVRKHGSDEERALKLPEGPITRVARIGNWLRESFWTMQ